MDKTVIRFVMSRLLMLLSILMIPSMLVAICYKEESYLAFLITILITFGIGLIISIKTPNSTAKIKVQSGIVIATMCWILSSLFGALPFYISGNIPSYTNAFFETMSGFTTTGATVLSNVEVLDNGMLFWRSFTHWVGGMGILVVAVALFPTIGPGGFNLFRIESPGPTAERIVPKIKDTAKILYTTYAIITVLEFVLLCLGGMSPLDSAIHTFGSVGTGGYSSKVASIGYYNSTYIRIVITIFMVMCGVNMSLYYDLYKRKYRTVYNNSELRLYLGIIVISALLITINLMNFNNYSFGKNIVDAFFQVGSVITTTGYSTVNFDQWPSFSKTILFLLMFIGGSAGSTAGSIKVIRILVILKGIRLEVQKLFHPGAIMSVRVDNKAVSQRQLMNISSFVLMYAAIFAVGTLLISIEGYDFFTNASAVATTLGNVGPGFALVGPANNFGFFSIASKWMFSLLMLIGRLEIFTVIALLSPKLWKRDI